MSVIPKQDNIRFFPWNLSDIWANIQPEPIYNLEGRKIEEWDTQNIDSQEDAVTFAKSDGSSPSYFITGNKIVAYLARYKVPCTNIITFVIPTLRNLYWDNRLAFPTNIISYMEPDIKEALPRFYDIFNYNKLKDAEPIDDITRYQLFGTISPYDVIHIPVSLFISAFNSRTPFDVRLGESNIIVRLTYEEYELWDESLQRIITFIPDQCLTSI